MIRPLLLLLLGLAAVTPAHAEPRAAAVRVDLGARSGPLAIDRMALGQGGQSPEPMWETRVAEIRALRPRTIRLFVQEYFRLMPEGGRYEFEALDRSVEAIRRTGAEPLMCLCFKPHALFPTIDQDIVEPTDYAAWDRLIEALVRHYKQKGAGIRLWEVANEPDIGESGGCPYRFQPESYVRYYRHTAAAILRADPEARAGGPALASVRSPILPALLDAAARGDVPLHFVSWHIYTSDPRRVRETVEFARQQLAARPKLKSVETFLDEWNMDLFNPPADRRFQPCFVLETIWQMKDAGLDASCYYQICDYHVDRAEFLPFMSEAGASLMARWWNRMPQFDGLFDYQNTVRPTYFAFKLLSRLTGERLAMTSSDPAIHGFATRDDPYQAESVLLWNFSPEPARVELTLAGLPGARRVHSQTLDALAPHDDENARLQPAPSTKLERGDHRLTIDLEPYGIRFWSLE
jgi:hypothetical protein